MIAMENERPVQALRWDGDILSVLDQRKLPEVVAYNQYDDTLGVTESIKSMQVRGAPAIGIAAAYGVYLSVRKHLYNHSTDWIEHVDADIKVLADSRPTAVNLFWALSLMQNAMQDNLDDPLPVLLKLAVKIHEDDIAANRTMGKLGANILGDAKSVLTHCNAGALATGGYGTALGVIRSAWGKELDQVYATETRPWLQGARLTVWELQQDNIPTTLIADSAAAFLMAQGKVDWVIVGADRIALNGDVANKIGTYSLAILAKQHGVKLMVVAPTSTIDWHMENGNNINIEQRGKNELLNDIYLQEHSLVQAWNPVFDVTPAKFITAIITEKGTVINPETKGVRSLMT